MKNLYNLNRSEKYKFYRSIGYSRKQAQSARNRGNKRIINDYSNHQKERRLFYETKKQKSINPYRPNIKNTKKVINKDKEYFKKFKVPDSIINKMLASDSLQIDLYKRRVPLLKTYLAPPLKWKELMKKLLKFQDLGDWFDYLGELYQEHN